MDTRAPFQSFLKEVLPRILDEISKDLDDIHNGTAPTHTRKAAEALRNMEINPFGKGKK